MEIRARKRMAAGRKSAKRKELKMTANVKSIFSLFFSYTGTLCHTESDASSVVSSLKSTV